MSKNSNIGQNMIIVLSNWGPYKTFKLMAVTKDCPYLEAIYDPRSKILAVISKFVKNSYHMVPKLDDNGDQQSLKIGKRPNGKDFKEQRVMMETHAEYYINDIAEIKDFVKIFGLNAKSHSWEEIMERDLESPNQPPLPSDKATNLEIIS